MIGSEDKVVCKDFLNLGMCISKAERFPLYILSGDVQWFLVVGLCENNAFFD
jgi:hypothetical protein